MNGKENTKAKNKAKSKHENHYRLLQNKSHNDGRILCNLVFNMPPQDGGSIGDSNLGP